MIQVIKKHKGLGDTVEFILDRTGLSYAVKMAAKSVGIADCGCEERKEELNDPNLLVNKIFYGDRK